MRHTFLALAPLFLASLAAGQAPAAKQVYERKATWSETMLATRANCNELLKGAKETQLDSAALTKVWAQIAKDWPAQSAWFRRDLPGNRYLDWFAHASDVSFEQWIMGLELPRTGTMQAELRQEFDGLQRAKAPAHDSRWLDLYGRACRVEQVQTAAKRIWVVELRRVLEGRAAELNRARTAQEHASWTALQREAAQYADKGPVTHAGSVTDLRAAITALGSRLTNRTSLLKKLDEAEPRWNATIAAVVKRDAKAMVQVPALYKEVRDFRRSLLRAAPGMLEFLETWNRVGLEQEWENQFAVLMHDLGKRAAFEKVAGETLRRESLVFASDRDPADIVLRRTAALRADLEQAALSAPLSELQKLNAALAPANTEARYILFAEACRLRRGIALANPLLGFNKLLFTKRHLAIYNHMCDQFYGIAARPGGALCVLEDPFRPNARVRDLLANSVVESGRLKGEKLSGGPNRAWNIRYDGMGKLSGEETEGGSFLSPDVSFDGKQITFAYVELRGDREHRTHLDPSRGHWAEGRSYHVFKAGADGSRLQQLTDGTWNDFDPCFMPSGRIAFTSERRGGYLRCGRVCPTYTVHDMAADGSDIRGLSAHETNEWNPSVANDGRIVYTRWDYVDRHAMVAHHPWMMTPEGRDPRAVQGNFTARQSRPDMEQDVRAIPGSAKFVATAAPHHSQSFGSLVVFDPRIVDDQKMSSVKRLTPDVGFPESQGGTWAYGEPWPLSEDYHLCVYDAASEVPELGAAGNHGIYLVDSFGNKELIYRDPAIGSHSPMPLAPRPKPPVFQEPAGRFVSGQSSEATVAVVNVYRSRLPWPEGTKIAALRVLQVLPLSVASTATAHNTGLQIPGSSSINIARAVLGTVPVEADGSAYFNVPAGKEVFFQALDANGLAVTSMRSATQFQPGEVASCQGCHEPSQGTPQSQSKYPLALLRAPSRLQPDVDGSNPFSYPRLVQPVLEKNCVACHQANAGKAPPLNASIVSRPSAGFMDRPTKYYASYMSLTPKFGFYNYGGDLNSIPGKFGARAAPLWQMLSKGHHEAKLTADEMHRIALWLDCLSSFYGVYEKDGGEAQLRGEIAGPTLQ